MDREIRLCLSDVNIVNKSLSKNNKDPVLLKKYNFQSLFNLLYVENMYGPLVNLWEGINQGKGYLRHVKLKIISVHTKI